MQGLTLDWLTFSLKPDLQAENKRDIDLPFVIDFLNLKKHMLNFESGGGGNGYKTGLRCNGFCIYSPAPELYEQMGYCVMISGDALRWYASLFANFSLVKFMKRLIKLTESGISLNVSRFDIALDDKEGILDLDVIISKAQADEYVSTARTKQTIREIVKFKGDKITGRTIYFGSRKSSSFVRIYDKAVEQGVSGHWIRVEFEFKQETAMRIVNALCAVGDKFPEYFAEVANHYLRFIEMDNVRASRCSISEFWSKFLGTIKRTALTVDSYKRKTFRKLLEHVLHAYAPSLYTITSVLPPELFEALIARSSLGRLKQKHYDMIDDPDIFDVRNSTYSDNDRDTVFTNAQKWACEVPRSLSGFGQLSIA